VILTEKPLSTKPKVFTISLFTKDEEDDDDKLQRES
jgi:hypothetical protein